MWSPASLTTFHRGRRATAALGCWAARICALSCHPAGTSRPWSIRLETRERPSAREAWTRPTRPGGWTQPSSTPTLGGPISSHGWPSAEAKRRPHPTRWVALAWRPSNPRRAAMCSRSDVAQWKALYDNLSRCPDRPAGAGGPEPGDDRLDEDHPASGGPVRGGDGRSPVDPQRSRPRLERPVQEHYRARIPDPVAGAGRHRRSAANP